MPSPVRKRIDLRRTLFILPNLITLSSIFCGFYSIKISGTATQPDDFQAAALLLVFAMIFDILDGRVARMTKTQSAFGLQIDSLADVISFGVAPALLVYRWSLHQLDTVGLIGAFLFCACGAIRLARFNVLSMGEQGAPTKPGKYIVGLPTPGAAGILISIIVANHAASGTLASQPWAWVIFAVTLLLSFFMVSTVKFRSFKDVKPSAATFAFVLFTLVSSIAVASVFKPAFVLVWLLAFYVGFGVLESLLHLSRRVRRIPRDSVPPAQ